MNTSDNRTALLRAAIQLQERAGELLLHHQQQVRRFLRTKPTLSLEEQQLACQRLEALLAEAKELLRQATGLRGLSDEVAEHDVHAMATLLQ